MNAERNAEIYRLRKKGVMTFADLGKQFSLSRERIRQICAKAARHEKWVAAQEAEKAVPLMDRALERLGLSVRAQHCLAHLGLKTVGDLHECRISWLLRGPNFGRKTVNEVRYALQELGLGLRD